MHDPSHDSGRRDFLRGTLTMPVALGASIGAAAWLTGCAREPAVAEGFRFLRPQDLPMLERLLPAVVGSAAPSEPQARTAAVAAAIRSYDRLLADTSPEVRSVFMPLFDLLTMGLTRGPLFGVWSSWREADEAAAARMLDEWAGSSTEFMRGAYNGFVAFTTMAWYLDPAGHAAAGYPGPPRKIVADTAV
ncbi:MAG: twin-arginine translocation pathway signal protein [Pseudomonadota bacterium]